MSIKVLSINRLIPTILLISNLASFVSCSTLSLLHPKKLKENIGAYMDGKWENGMFESSLGNFGEFEYGNLLVGRVHYPKENKDGCLPFKDEHFD